jgi:lipoyl(octanoyl) transferase
MREVWVVRAGLVGYEEARALQKRLESARHAGEIPDLLILLEHPPTYTKGRRTDQAELPMGEEWYRMQGIEVTDTDRGGRVTYHGPGQLVAYPIVSLKALADRDTPGRIRPSAGSPVADAPWEEVARIDVVEYIRRMERVMIAALGDWSIDAQVIEGLTGVWTMGEPPPTGEARKIGSIGIHVNRGITTHGLAINVNNDLQPFEWIVPCGIEAVRMTSVARELGAEQDLDAFAGAVARRFGETYERRPVEVEREAVMGETVASVR